MIQTQGFRLSNLPRFTPADPSLVAFNPMQAAQGAGTAFTLAGMLDRIQAERARQDELAMMRPSAMEAGILRNQASAAKDRGFLGSGLANLQPQVDVARANQSLATIQPETQALLSGFDKRVKTDASDLRLLGPVESARRAQAESIAQLTPVETKAKIARLPSETGAVVAENIAREGEAKGKRLTQAARNSVEEGKLALAQTMLGYAQKAAPAEQALKMLQLVQKLDSAESDEDVRKVMQELDIRLKESMIAENEGQALYAAGMGRQTGAKTTPEKEAADILRFINTLDKTQIGDGVRTLSAYVGETFEGGKVKNSGIPLINRGPKQRDALGDFMLELRAAYAARLQELRGEISGRAPQGGPLQRANPLIPAGGPPVGTVVDGFKFKGGNPKDKNNWVKAAQW